MKHRMHIAYIHHGLRKNAEKEKLFVKNLAEKFDIPFHFKKINIKKDKDKSLEEQARIKRYKALAEIAKKSGCIAIFTAHTLDDQVETVLLNLISGSGIKGLCGMQKISKIDNQIMLVRPLLSVKKKQILSYIAEKHLYYMFDESNLDIKFRRNLIRHKILPILEKINPKVKNNIFRTSKILADDFDYLDLQAKKFYSEKSYSRYGFVEFPLKKFLRLHPSIQRLVLRMAIMELCDLFHPPDFATIENIRLSVLAKKKTFIDKLKIFVFLNQDSIRLCKKDSFENSFLKKSHIISVCGVTEIKETGWKIETGYKKFSTGFLKNKNMLVAYINPARIKGKLVLRKPDNKMSFLPLGMKKTVSFKKYWKTHKKKIATAVEFPAVIENNNKIVWVVGGHISQEFAVSEKTDVLEIKVNKE